MRADEASDELFENRIRPVLMQHCHQCHASDAKEVKGGLVLDSRDALLKGGDSGPAIVPGKANESRLVQALRHEDGFEMPPEKPKLPQSTIDDFARWINQGAPFPAAGEVTRSAEHWSFQPLRDPAVPDVKRAEWPRTPVDRFVLARLEQNDATPAPEASKRALIRRATYDLTGLPPTFEEVETFLADESPDAFQKVVDRLLSSRHYGERWGRHWLDVVRYADTAGENSDHPVPHAWRYRNWVVDAFNRDLPYDEFIRKQIAGDLLAQRGPAEEYAENVVATGYLAIARRFDHDIDKYEHLTLEDTLDTLGKSVLGLTIGCARCHNHKYDPITTRDYYGLYGIFASTKFAFPGCEPKQQPRDLVALLPRDESKRLVDEFEKELAQHEEEVRRLEQVTELAAGELSAGAEQTFRCGGGEAPSVPLAVRRGELVQFSVFPRASHGADSTGLELKIEELNGAKRQWELTRDLLRDFMGNGVAARMPDGFGNAGVWNAVELAQGPVVFTQLVRDIEQTPGVHGWRGRGDTPSVFVNFNEQPARFLTVSMPARCVAVHPGPNSGVAVAWKSPIDGTIAVTGRVFEIDPGGDGVDWKLQKRRDTGATSDDGETARRLAAAIARRDAFAAKRPVVPVAYAVAEGQPRDARIQRRGDPLLLGDEVPRKFLDVLGGQTVPPGTNASGRLELANWLTDADNPLTARVMVNRIWQHHFGRGIVETPNDFGTRGQPPVDPDLLDHLATQFVRGGWSVKAMHRLIMSSAAYRMASRSDAAPAHSFAAFLPRRLSAEELRDSLLVASGELDRTPGEAHPFPPEDKWSFTQHAPFSAEYETNRRTVYVMVKRNRRDRFLALFDGADPNASTPQRQLTTVPTQALYFLNDPFVHARAQKLAERVVASADNDGARADQAYRILFARPATPQECDEAQRFLTHYAGALPAERAGDAPKLAWAAMARVLFASNEFSFVE